MAVTYGGVPLKGNDREVDALIAQYLPTRDVYEWEGETHPLPNRQFLTQSGYVPNLSRPIKTGHLWWPRGASRWAVAHFLCSDNDLALIRPLAQPSTGYTSLPLVLSGKNGNSISPQMWMLPARPLSNIAGTNGLKLLTLVDTRFWWWMGNTGNMAAQSTWTGMFAAVGVMLGISIAVDPIPAAYLTPATFLASSYEYVPNLLDACAMNVGMRFTRSYAGVCAVRGWASAESLQDMQMADGTNLVMGGRYKLGDS
jgi:hypothetical protein